MSKTILISIGILVFTTLPAYSSTTSTINELYYEELNKVENPIALLVMFDGAPGYAKDIPAETRIPNEAKSANIQCIGINQTELFLSDTIYERIKNTISFCLVNYKIPNNTILMAGFSLGGYTVFRFTEMAKEKGEINLVPKAIVGVDPLLDHTAAYQYALREIDRECDNEGSKQYGKPEANWLKKYYLTNFGTPEKNKDVYINRSAYSFSSKDAGNARYLLDIPVLLYHETDVMWYIKERCRSILDENIIVGSQFINFLYNHGNKNALLIETNNKGIRADGRRHPHSWSIADPKETIEWFKRYLK